MPLHDKTVGELSDQLFQKVYILLSVLQNLLTTWTCERPKVTQIFVLLNTDGKVISGLGESRCVCTCVLVPRPPLAKCINRKLWEPDFCHPWIFIVYPVAAGVTDISWSYFYGGRKLFPPPMKEWSLGLFNVPFHKAAKTWAR